MTTHPGMTVPQRKMLESMAAGEPYWKHLRGMSGFGGAVATLRALKRRGWAETCLNKGRGTDWRITDAGRAALAVRI